MRRSPTVVASLMLTISGEDMVGHHFQKGRGGGQRRMTLWPEVAHVQGGSDGWRWKTIDKGGPTHVDGPLGRFGPGKKRSEKRIPFEHG
jgi:hypothetical protein